MKDILGRKLGIIRVFTESGTLISVTVVEACPNVILQKKMAENDGYEAVQLGFRDVKGTCSTRGEVGHVAKVNTALKRFIKEARGNEFVDPELGAEVNVGVFSIGEAVNVIGISKGEGLMGTIAHNNVRIGPEGHGSGHYRHTGSLTTNGITSRQGKILKGTTTAGQEDGYRTTNQNLTVIKVDVKNNYLLIKGDVPRLEHGMVIMRIAKCSKGNTEPVTLVDCTREEE